MKSDFQVVALDISRGAECAGKALLDRDKVEDIDQRSCWKYKKTEDGAQNATTKKFKGDSGVRQMGLYAVFEECEVVEDEGSDIDGRVG